MRPGFLFFSITMLALVGCAPRVLTPQVVPGCQPAILAEPLLPDRPELTLWYKIEEGREYFIMDRGDYISARDYILKLEGAVDFSIGEIRENNRLQVPK